MRTRPGLGGVPSNVILPAMLPAVAAFTGLTVGAGVAGAELSGPPPPPAAAVTAKATRARLPRLIDLSPNEQLSHAASTGLGDLAEHAILHPLRIPPFDGIHGLAVYQHGEVQVIAAGEPRHAAA